DDALRELERAVSLEKEDAIIRDHLGDAHFEKGNFNNARREWEISLKLDSSQEKVKKKINNLESKIKN
ncbi:MAG: hypothetical protein NG740_05410, partial [Omnitrophica bacterium]|nr:hypothetical protein [Candidatus Omnitrophota bacterium]